MPKQLLPYLCPIAAVTGMLALVVIDLHTSRSPAIDRASTPADEGAAPVIRLLDISDRKTLEAWRDDFVELTTSDSVLWIDRPAAQQWHEEIATAARLTNLSPSLIAEVVGMESGFRNIKNPASTAYGFGQQIATNQIMKACRLDRGVPAQSILGAALELRWDLDRYNGSLEKALDAYGTTARLRDDLRKRVLARMRLAEARL